MKEHLAELQAFWEDRGMRLVELSDGWRFQTASELGPRFLRLDEEKAAPLFEGGHGDAGHHRLSSARDPRRH